MGGWLLPQVDEFASWLGGKVKEQEGKQAHEAPVFESQEVDSWLDKLKKVGEGAYGACFWAGMRPCIVSLAVHLAEAYVQAQDETLHSLYRGWVHSPALWFA